MTTFGWTPSIGITGLFYRNMQALFRYQCWQEVNGYSANMKGGYEDWDFWLSIIANGYQWYTIPEYLFYYRDRPGSMLKTSDANRNELISWIFENHRKYYQANFEPIIKEYAKEIGKLKQLLTIKTNEIIRHQNRINKFFPYGSLRRKILKRFFDR